MKLGFISLTACEGCQFAILDLGERFLELAKRASIADMRLIREEPEITLEFDIIFVEGNPTLKQQYRLLRQARMKAKKLIVLGNCAHLGGVWEIKNYHDKKEIIKHVYKNYKKIENNDITCVPLVVPVDGFIPGCPITGEEFLQIVYNLLEDQKTLIPERPVCYECQLRENECLLQKCLPCLGPVTLGGCQSVCLNSGQPCWGCRGLLKNIDRATIKSLLSKIGQCHNEKEVKMMMEVFGVRDDIEALLANQRG